VLSERTVAAHTCLFRTAAPHPLRGGCQQPADVFGRPVTDPCGGTAARVRASPQFGFPSRTAYHTRIPGSS